MDSVEVAHSLAFIVLALILYTFVSHNIQQLQHLSKARRLGCRIAPSPRRLWWDLFNLHPFHRLVKAARQGLLFDFLEETLTKLREQGGFTCRTFSTHRFGSTTFLTLEPENIKAVLSTNREDYTLEKRVRWFGPLIGSRSLFTTDGKDWAHNRAIIKPALTREHFGDLITAEKHNNNLTKCLLTDSSRWTSVVDLLPLFCRLTMDSSTEFLWGESVNSQMLMADENSALQSDFATAYDQAQEVLSVRMQLDGLYWLRDSFPFRRACQRCHEIVRPHIQRVLSASPKTIAYHKKLGVNKKRYILLEELAQQTRNPAHLLDSAMGLLLAGRDTTAALLGWLFYYLARHPDTYAQLRSSVIGDFGSAAEPLEITFEKLKACKLLQWCLFEALRLRPPVPLNGLNAVRDTILPTGGGTDGTSPLLIPKGARVAYSVYLLHIDKAIWGEDAKTWRPERWAARKNGWDYLPFNAGPRICPGQQYALTLAAYTTVKMLQRFDCIENCDRDVTTRMTATLVSFSQTGVKVRLREAAVIP